MQTRAANPAHSDNSYEVDECPQCGGLWLDKSEQLDVCPTVAGLEKRELEIKTLGSASDSVRHCPRCHARPYKFRIVDLEIDYCTGCGGVWLEANEQRGLVHGVGAKRKGAARGNPYRAIRQVVDRTHMSCTRCAQRSQTSKMYLSESGPLCRPCYFAAIGRKQAAGEAPLDELYELVGSLVQ